MKPELVQLILSQLPVKPSGIHGVLHWARVLFNARELAELTGARQDVIEYFALLHDARRFNEWGDHQHGPRAAALAQQLRPHWIGLDDAGFALLVDALKDHTGGESAQDITVGVCWDADRLDLMRVGIRPRPELLITPQAREEDRIVTASKRAAEQWAPVAILTEWGLGYRRF